MLVWLPALAAELDIVPSESILAIVTHKGGMAAGLAHNHLVAATGYEAALAFDPEAPEEARFEFHARAADLVIDSPELNARWYPRLEELGILAEPFKEMSDKDRNKVRETMRGRKQLDVERFPEIAGSIVAVERSGEADAEFPYVVRIAFEVHGQRVERDIRGRVEPTENGVILEGVGDFRFTDFGIEPYSAFLGTVKNKDDSQLYVRLVAIPSEN